MRTLVSLVLAFHASFAAAQLYSWKDADGKIHYSDQPPAAQPSRKLSVPPPNTYSGDVPKKAAPRQAPQAPASKPAPAAEADKGKAPPPSKKELCEKAKADLAALENGPRRGSVGVGGKFHPIDGEQRDADDTRLRQAIDDNCR